MSFKWIKHYLPRSFSGRAALILLVPIVSLQLVVSIVFIQRHYEGVTRQMTDNMVLELNYLLEQVNSANDVAEGRLFASDLEKPLAMQIALPSKNTGQTIHTYDDLSGRVIITILNSGLKGVLAVDLLSKPKTVQLWIQTKFGPMLVMFPRYRVAATNPHQLLVLMIFTGILMTVIAFLFMRNQVRPIKRLAVAAEAFGKGRIVPYTPSGATEVRAAGGAFINMRDRIERHIEQRTMMLSGVSHDLRTPLTRLKLGLSMIDDEETDALNKDVEDMTRLLDEFLNFAKVNAEDQTIRSEPMEIVHEVVDNVRRQGFQIDILESQETGLMPIRPNALKRALENLIGNALQYGTRARVSVRKEEHFFSITIEDDGPGIDPNFREEALKPFSRLEPARNQNKGSGVGLGLAITVDIARAHGGELVLDKSDDLGGLKAILKFAS